MRLGYEIDFHDGSMERLISDKKSMKLVFQSETVIDLEKNTYIKSRGHENGSPVHPDVLQNFRHAKEITDPDAAAERIQRKRDRMKEQS